MILYEGFDYGTVGDDLDDVSSFVDDDPVDTTVPVVAPGLSFGGLDVSGNSASLTGVQFWARRPTTPAASFEAGGTWYMSALVQYDTGGATWASGREDVLEIAREETAVRNLVGLGFSRCLPL